jgi:hypothetical protein
MEPWTAVELFDQWFNQLGLPFRKLIVPLGHNYSFDKDFIIDWLGGIVSYNNYFHGHVRDSMSAALFINDVAEWQSENIPHPKVNLSYLCSCLGVQLLQKHDALADALASAECYKRLMATPLIVNHGVPPISKVVTVKMREEFKLRDKIEKELNDTNDKEANCTDQQTESTKESDSPPSV